MQLKREPEDFVVEENLAAIAPAPEGPFVLYRVDKRNLSQLELIRRLGKALSIHPREVATAGLKDKAAVCSTHLSVRPRDPGEALANPPEINGATVTGIQRMDRPIRSTDIESNRFTIVVRNLDVRQVENVQERAATLADIGLPNYFDDQRFGGESPERGFVANLLISNQPYDAIVNLLARPSRKDARGDRLLKKSLKPIVTALAKARSRRSRPPQKALKQLEAFARFAKGELAPVVRALAKDPRDPIAAVNALEFRLRELLYQHVQSHRWNQQLASFVEERFERRTRFQILNRAGRLLFWRALTEADREALKELRPPFEQLREQAATLGLKHYDGDRAAWLRPTSLSVNAPESGVGDRYHVTVSLELPRGVYATLVVKRLFAHDGL
ncbi:MAG: tRNA pseudouridine(13) synthase TruD [Planctomycetota bacterium]|jgi:tRNA pseudouridine13 synthase